MHVVEHVGLGRYGDLMDPDGDLKAMRELRRVACYDQGREIFQHQNWAILQKD
jgi:hypothetical protein